MRAFDVVAFATLTAAFGSAAGGESIQTESLRLPYRQVGLDEREAAAFLLDRLTFGARPGEVDRVVAAGLERWVAKQLAGTLPEPELETRLAGFDALKRSPAELVAKYPNSSQLSAHVRRFHPGLIPPRDEPILDFSVVTAKLDAYRAERGILSQDRELKDQVLGQKVLRAVYAENQLRERLTDFWQNHFFTSPISFNARIFVLPFERDALRPNALGSFGGLLEAAVKHPALLQYYVGTADPANIDAADTTLGRHLADKVRTDGESAAAELEAVVRSEIEAIEREEDLVLARQFWSATGPNRNFARSLLTLQTLGPDGPQTDADIAEAARVFTGWSTLPIGPSPEWFSSGFVRSLEAGFVREGVFLFRADQHDALPKRVLGEELLAGGGVDEGERLLATLAAHPSTARHIARKLAVRFADDMPDEILVTRLERAFQESEGSIQAVLRALVEAPEFWAAARKRTKVKSPFELAVSALRATDAEISETAALVERIAAMGQPLYSYLEPTGYPDESAYWLDPAAMIERINFARDLTSGRIEGVRVDVAAIRGPAQERADTAAAYAARLLPERDVRGTVRAIRAAFDSREAGIDREVTALLLASPAFQLR